MMDALVSLTFLQLQILLWISQETLAQFVVTAPPHPVVAVVGEDVILDCQLVPARAPENMEVRWLNVALTYTSPVHLYKDGADDLTLQASAYKGRTEMFLDQMVHGNLSLRLKRVQVSDKGQYKCFVASTAKHNEAKITLDVTGTGRQPLIEMVAYKGSGITLACKSEGWFPQPPVQWIYGSGKNMTAQPQTTYHPNTEGLYTVQSKIDIFSDSTNKYTCLVNNDLLKESQQAHIQIAGTFFPHVSGWLVAFWIFFFAMVAALCLALWYRQQLQKKIMYLTFAGGLIENKKLLDEMEQERMNVEQEYKRLRKEIEEVKATGKLEREKLRKEFEIERGAFKAEHEKLQSDFADEKKVTTAEYQKLQTEFEQWRPLAVAEWDRIQTNAAAVKLDAQTAHASLTVSPNGSSVRGGEPLTVPDNPERFDSVPYVLGSGGFTAGRHYWEVEVGTKTYWDVGVAKESVRRKGMPNLCTDEGFWTIGRDAETYGISDGNRSSVAVTTRPEKIGVYLDLEVGRVSFYNAHSMFHLHTFNTKFSERVYPFFWPGWDDVALTIWPVKN